jgi:hypothetical protein
MVETYDGWKHKALETERRIEQVKNKQREMANEERELNNKLRKIDNQWKDEIVRLIKGMWERIEKLEKEVKDLKSLIKCSSERR